MEILLMNKASFKLIQGSTFTHVRLSGRAIAVKQEYKVKQVFSDNKYLVLHQDMKQTSMLTINIDEDLVFEGWGLPFTLQTELSGFLACGCYIFVSKNPVHLKKYIELYNLNKDFKNRNLIIYVDNEKDYHLLYPNLESTNHMIRSLKKSSL